MALIVQKYGGTSVGDLDRIHKVAQRIQHYREKGYALIVVVSAMGRTTDELIALARRVNPRPHPRELDLLTTTGEQTSVALLALQLQAMGIPARGFVQHQIGIRTDGRYANARITEVNPHRILEAVREGKVAVVAGFMGTTPEGELTTLGRGGSDTTAVAIAAAVGAKACEIYTDTEGVYTTDPHLIPEANKLPRIGYDQMLEMAALGAQVLHPRAVWYAKRYGVVLHVRSSFSYNPGTIVAEEGMKLDRPVTGVALDLNHAQIGLIGIPDRPGVAAKVFEALGSRGIAVDMIIQGVPGHDPSRQQMAFTVPKDSAEEALEALEDVLAELGGEAVLNPNIAKVSIVGVALASTPGIPSRMFEAVASVGANIEMIATSEVRISVIIPAEYAEAAVRAVHAAFELDRLDVAAEGAE
ncbi:aspartate kinase [Marinithermus hydrothermalis]|uniref:Aspartokinase n=1 Tax=Marinithermus hydrothermalis (strain DSM 14884 / JCM 11576 / T1) TaxID=869210 RepID=F2NPE6_MARHT|nr:aspartate kinase [Marinithermus hydrothermalis]AEB12227.1 aspartate kinase [Marinithermus hydrothermalis DSM 14884]